MPQEYSLRQQAHTGRTELGGGGQVISNLFIFLKCILWVCEGASGRKRERQLQGWGLEAAEVAGLRLPGGDGGENKSTEAETGPQHPRSAQILPKFQCAHVKTQDQIIALM